MLSTRIKELPLELEEYIYEFARDDCKHVVQEIHDILDMVDHFSRRSDLIQELNLYFIFRWILLFDF